MKSIGNGISKKGYYTTNPNKYYTFRAKQSAYNTQQQLLANAEHTQDDKAIQLNKTAPYNQQHELEIALQNTPESSLLPRQETTQGELSVIKNFNGDYHVRANRVVNGNAYQYISLQLMQTLTEDKGVPKFIDPIGLPELDKVYTEVRADPILAKFNNYVIQQGLRHYKSRSLFDFHPINAGLSEQESQYLYHEYIHASLQAELHYMLGNYFGKYITNGSNNYNKDIDNFEPVRVTILGYADGVANRRHNERLQADKERTKSERKQT